MILALDLEFDQHGFQCGALVGGGTQVLFEREKLPDIVHVLRNVPLVVGHNIRRFDLPRLGELVGEPLKLEEDRLIDTLELAALVWPGRPSQALEKLYRDTQVANDPVADCLEAIRVLDDARTDAAVLPPLVKHWAQRLLPDGGLRRVIPAGTEDWAPLRDRLGEPAAEALRVHLSALPEAQISNLGALVFLHWCLQRDDPSHRRPIWVELTFPSFLAAEAALGPINTSREALTAELQAIYGPEYGFRAGQFEIVQALLAGDCVPLGLLPTGGGKSLTFQFPGLLLSRLRRALTVVVCPLTALMEDQVLNLRVQLPGWAERVAYLTGNQSPDEQRAVLDGVWEGRIDVLYVSPERLRNPGMQRLLRHRRPALWVLDEAHTFSQWGMDFRPDFLRIARAIREIHEGGPAPLLGLVTATATTRVSDDLEKKLVAALGDVLNRPMRRVPDDVDFQWRGEISTEVVRLPFSQRLAAIRQRLLERRGQGVAIVYVQSRKLAELYAEDLGEHLRAAAFHGGLPPRRKGQTLEAFKAGDLDVVVATNAFGMGIDRAGIHTVLHAGPPSTPEAYLQEIGRVARKPGETGHAVLFWEEQDFQFAFEFEKQSRVGNSKNLRECWGIVRDRLKEDPVRRWVSSFEFGAALPQTDPDDLTTQARVALYALEAYDLVKEGESQPARLNLRLEVGQGELGEEGRRLWEVLKRQGLRPGDETSLDLREAALLAALRPNKVVTGARQLVKAGYARWSYDLTLRARKGTRTRLDRAGTSLRALLEQLDAHPDADLSQLHVQAIREDLTARRRTAQLELALKTLAALGVARFRIGGAQASLEPYADAPPRSAWTTFALARFEVLQGTWGVLEQTLSETGSDTLVVNAADLDAQLPDVPGGLNAMESLLALETLGIVDVARGDEMQGRVFYLEKGDKYQGGKTPSYHPAAFRPLEQHYADRTRRLHAMRLMALELEEAARVALIRDYFTLTLEEFCRQHFADPDSAAVPQLPEYAQRILQGLSPVQRQVVEDEHSRAILVLAGPGSGKTRTVVHRVANLIALKGVPSDRVLVLAYNRTAAAEVRDRLATLVGPLGVRVDVLTFHGLARKLTGLSDRDAVDEQGQRLYGDAAHAWLLQQAILLLKEQDPPYQYVLVDEYQDVDALKYAMVTQLARYQPNGGEDEDQPGYLVAVGDDDQNLYGFQGADIRYIQQFQQDYQIAPEQVVGLVENYRSARRIVAAANAFIDLSLPAEHRLKTGLLQVRGVRDEDGVVAFGRYTQRFFAAQAIAQRTVDLTAAGTPLHDIAVLAPRWDLLEEVEHALREMGLPVQRYDCDDQLRPANSALGRHLLTGLRQNLTAMSADAKTTLSELSAPYSVADRAAGALWAAVEGLRDVTYETIALKLEGARPLAGGRVVLSSYHSAKGSEFDVVFVLDEGDRMDEDATRALYVALTRPRNELYLLRNVRACHPTFKDKAFMTRLAEGGVEAFEVPRDGPLPTQITFTLDLEPGQLYLSAREVVSGRGRQVVDRYAQEWGPLTVQARQQKDGRSYYTFSSSQGVVARTRAFWPATEQDRVLRRLHHLLQRGAACQARGGMVMLCERDDEFYRIAQYTGDATSHFLVLPCLELQREVSL
ncbi:UvrD-helicase domain-containing protein [Deinococcus sp. HMF7604]|uniref:UvrD-helicase domain-containing protein n=1 Tax=Deinococcus betulae TaxID=2873312 RepID=UPI001CCAB5AD|nr:UvrD-helicase domain-containing protein [Deinococcus betulae]MBZ9753496.1 UvrD-helicase domain-containing protein [Deinococcus betulae]